MRARNSILAALVVAAGAVAANGTVRADHAEERQPLHAARGPVEVVVPDDVVLDRNRVLRRLDRALTEVDELVALVREEPVRGRREGAERFPEIDAIFGAHGPRRDRVDTDALREHAEHLRNQLVQLRRMAERAPGVPVVVEPVIVPIAPRELQAFLRNLDQARFSSEKLAMVRDLASHAHVASEQAARIVEALPSWVQVEAALELYEVTVDPEAFHRVYAAFRFDGDRQRLRERLARRAR